MISNARLQWKMRVGKSQIRTWIMKNFQQKGASLQAFKKHEKL
jgi:hypothetical protein